MKFHTWTTLFLSLVLGTGSAVVATALTFASLSNYALNLSRFSAPSRLIDERVRTVPLSVKEAMDHFRETALPSVVSVFGPEDQTGYGYQIAQAEAAVVMTSDGWLLMSANSTAIPKQQIFVDQQLYPIQTVVVDPVTQIAFVKIQANALSVVDFGSGWQAAPGDQVFVSRSPSSFQLTSIKDIVWLEQGQVVSSDVPTRRLVLAQNTEQGSIVYNLRGEWIGMVQLMENTPVVLPVDGLLPLFTQLLASQALSRPSLGLFMVDISRTIGWIQKETTRGRTYGAWIVGFDSTASARAAKTAGLKIGDIILTVNGERINETASLDERITLSDIGDELELTVDRAGEMITLSIPLGSVSYK